MAMTGKIETETKTYALCPSCDGRLGTIDHLVGDLKRVGPWHCDRCGEGWSFRTDGVSVCDLEANGEKYVDVTVMLVLPPKSSPIRLMLHAKQYEPVDDGAEYFYDQHTCPINWMRNVVGVEIDGDHDPHGLFEFASIERGHTKPAFP